MRFIFVAMWVLVLFATTPGSSQTVDRSIRDVFVATPQWYAKLIQSKKEVFDLYKNTGYSRLWVSKRSFEDLLSSIECAKDDGLNPFDYHYELLLDIADDKLDQSQADVILSDAYLTFAKHLKNGRLDPKILFPSEWDAVPNQFDFVIELLQALNDTNVAGSLENLKPKEPLYCRLKSELQTVEQLDSLQNDSISEYRTKLLVNIEKCRWSTASPEGRVLKINIPTFELLLIERDSCIMSMKAIVGRPERKTPVLRSAVTSLVINPEWTVPPTILKEDMLPSIQKNNDYLKRNNLRLIDHDGLEVQPDSLPWTSYNSDNFPFVIRQDPGVRNALGLVKFQFANRHGIYMHDTNMHALFSQGNRAFSSGCIRIERPFALAAYLLKGSGWNESSLHELVEKGQTKTIALMVRVAIETQYFTLYFGQGNHLIAAGDVYGWDAVIAQNLKLRAVRP